MAEAGFIGDRSKTHRSGTRMRIRDKFEKRYVVQSEQADREPSPAPGVSRVVLDRIGAERARATSIVHFEAGAGFPSHVHDGGEEILVLDGVFSDEAGDYPAGTYLRNPAGTMHAPWSEGGCRIFVKLRQFDADDTQRVVLDTRTAEFLQGTSPGLTVLPLHGFGSEQAALVRWEPGTRFSAHQHWGGEEILVLDGVFQDEHGRYPAGTWIRSPHMSSHRPWSDQGCLIYVKVGHLWPTERSLTRGIP